MATYYDPADLGKFGQIGTHGQELADKFFEWYGAATATDGALTKREKQLIGLAVAHTIQCPYCIDAYTQSCLESGADPTQMTEALHVAAAVRAAGARHPPRGDLADPDTAYSLGPPPRRRAS